MQNSIGQRQPPRNMPFQATCKRQGAEHIKRKMTQNPSSAKGNAGEQQADGRGKYSSKKVKGKRHNSTRSKDGKTINRIGQKAHTFQNMQQVIPTLACFSFTTCWLPRQVSLHVIFLMCFCCNCLPNCLLHLLGVMINRTWLSICVNCFLVA